MARRLSQGHQHLVAVPATWNTKEDWSSPSSEGGRHGTSGVQENFAERIAGAEAVVATDEGRFGMKVWFHRRWCPRGVRPPWMIEEHYEWLWVYAAVDLETGKSVFFFLSSMESACFQRFLEEVS